MKSAFDRRQHCDNRHNENSIRENPAASRPEPRIIAANLTLDDWPGLLLRERE
jgi:hypothetical protein